MDAVSMSTRALRDILRRAAETDLGFRICVARDIAGPGGSIFIRGHTELTERHLAWLEQRNPNRASTSTYVEVVFLQGSPPRSLPAEVETAGQPAPAARKRRRRAEEASKEVGARADEVVRQAGEVFRIVGDMAFPASALRNQRVRSNLQELNERILHFHGSVRIALDEYLEGNTLIMDLICQYGPGSRAVQHGLNAAVLATEIASLVLIEGEGKEGGFFASLYDAELLRKSGDADSEAAPTERRERRLQLLKRELVEIFLGGFMHDCALWNESLSLDEGHEAAGARLIHAIPELGELGPALGRIVLFHSDIIRLASKSGVVEIIEGADEPERISFQTGFYGTPGDARTALRLRHGDFRAEVLGEVDLCKILPVAMAEYFLTRSEGFDAHAPTEVVGNLADQAHGGFYEKFVVAMCNVEEVAPRRAYVELEGMIPMVEFEEGDRKLQHLDLGGLEGCSIGHGDDIYSPHLIILFAVGADGKRQKLEYVDPREGALWAHAASPQRRMYIAGGRHRERLTVRVTGFMSEEVYSSVLGEYEQELKRQMQV